MLEILPSIDLRRGEVVRLHQGDDAQRRTYSRDPRRLLQEFAAAGTKRVHLVDLDAAFGEAPQRELIAELVASTSLKVELGGGLRDEAAIAWAKSAGCERVVIGSLLLRDPALFAELAHQYPGFLVPALELRGGVPQGHGWRQGASVSLEELTTPLRGLPCPALLCTDVERDGTLAGPNFALASRLAGLTGLPAIVSGGVSGLADLEDALLAPGVEALIVGRAFYEGRFDLAAGCARLARRKSPEKKLPSGLAFRLVPCLDVKDGRVVKGLRFENLRDLGDPAESAALYAAEGADEIVFLDITAAPDGRDTNIDWVKRTAEQVFVPLTVGGGVRRLEDAERLLRAGADKVAVNTAAFERPALIAEIAERFGRQCVVLSVDARRVPENCEGGERPCRMEELDEFGNLPAPLPRWEVVTHGGRKPRGRDVLSWIEEGVALGAGEILLTSIDADGTREGYDLELLRAVAARIPVPIIASGGAGTVDHLAAGLEAGAQAVLAASMFHERTHQIGEVKEELARRGFLMRPGEVSAESSNIPAPNNASDKGALGREDYCPTVTPAKAGVQSGSDSRRLDPGLRRDDDGGGYAFTSIVGSPSNTDPNLLLFDDRGLLAVIVQEEGSGAVLMLAWANREAIDLTLESGDAWFFSRSRQELWRKGATSGNELKVVSVAADCDADAVLYRVRAAGPACHTGSRTCFDSRPGSKNPAALELGWLYSILEERRHASPEESYTARLLAAGRPRIAQKVGEEAVETVIAALSGDRDSLVGEAADLIYHLLVLLLECGVEPAELARKLQSRHRGASK
jgi:phosphoribosylformimino-5-aminoimidazole carboxamide ribotide isomerase